MQHWNLRMPLLQLLSSACAPAPDDSGYMAHHAEGQRVGWRLIRQRHNLLLARFCSNDSKEMTEMKSLTCRVVFVIIVLASGVIASGQTPPRTIDSYLSAAKVAAGTDWAGTFLRLCIPPPSAGAAPAAAAGGRGTPARESWYAEPAKVADNL